MRIRSAAVALIITVAALGGHLADRISVAYAQGCTFTLSRTNVLAGPEGMIYARTSVAASASTCQWTTSTSASWIFVNTTTRTGSEDSAFTLDANTSGATRTATVTVAGLAVNIIQQATPCVSSLTPSTLTFPYPGFGEPTDQTEDDPAYQKKNVTVDAPPDCHWQHSNWPLELLPNFTFGGVGSGVVSVGLITNRTIIAAIGSVPLTVTRLDPPCTFSTSLSNSTVSVNGGSGTLSVTGIGPDCTFTAAARGIGLSITQQSAPSAPATIAYTMTANPAESIRYASIRVPNASVTVQQNGAPAKLDVTNLSFGAVSTGGTATVVSPPEDIRLTLDEQAVGAWSLTTNQPWLIVTPTSGAGPATLRVSMDRALVPSPTSGINSDGFNRAEIAITAAFAPAAVRRLEIGLQVRRPDLAWLPRGVFETPLNNATNLSGALPVTGWANDDIGVTRIQIYRDPVAGEGTAEIYVADAIRVKGARPDVAGGPGGRFAGWGYLLLSNVLPGGGTGTFTLSAYVDDLDGHRVLLGRRTFGINNRSAIRPFGTIDAPAQGQTVSGTILNSGWVLTPAGKAIPFDGSTIKVYIDGVLLSSVASYNHARPDVKAFFPGLANSDGPEARLSIDTTLLAEGVHTIAWGVIDDAGIPEGIGSRYFTVQNGMSSLVGPPAEIARSAGSVGRMRVLKTDVWSREGMVDTAYATRVATDATGHRTLHASRGQRVELFLDPTLAAPCGTYEGHLLTGDVAGPLPRGASLDARHGVFRWQPTAEFSGTFEFTFVQRGCDGVERRIPLTIAIDPRSP